MAKEVLAAVVRLDEAEALLLVPAKRDAPILAASVTVAGPLAVVVAGAVTLATFVARGVALVAHLLVLAGRGWLCVGHCLEKRDRRVSLKSNVAWTAWCLPSCLLRG